MSNKLDHEAAGKADIAARPEVSNRPDAAINTASEAPIAPEKAETNLEPDDLEMSAGKLVARTLDELKKAGGGSGDPDFQRLITEVMGGMFAGLRCVTGRPWVRFAVAGGALAFSFIPAGMAFYAARNRQTKQTDGQNDGSL